MKRKSVLRISCSSSANVSGRIVEATVKAIVEKTDGVRLQVSSGNETALIYPWQIVEEVRGGY